MAKFTKKKTPTKLVSTFSIGDLVWAKMKRYRPWPACVIGVPASMKNVEAHTWVYFFGTHNFGNVSNDCLKPYKSFKYSKMKKDKTFRTAIAEITDYINFGPSIVKLPKFVPNFNDKVHLENSNINQVDTSFLLVSGNNENSPVIEANHSIVSQSCNSEVTPTIRSEPTIEGDSVLKNNLITADNSQGYNMSMNETSNAHIIETETISSKINKSIEEVIKRYSLNVNEVRIGEVPTSEKTISLSVGRKRKNNSNNNENVKDIKQKKIKILENKETKSKIGRNTKIGRPRKSTTTNEEFNRDLDAVSQFAPKIKIVEQKENEEIIPLDKDKETKSKIERNTKIGRPRKSTTTNEGFNRDLDAVSQFAPKIKIVEQKENEEIIPLENEKINKNNIATCNDWLELKKSYEQIVGWNTSVPLIKLYLSMDPSKLLKRPVFGFIGYTKKDLILLTTLKKFDRSVIVYDRDKYFTNVDLQIDTQQAETLESFFKISDVIILGDDRKNFLSLNELITEQDIKKNKKTFNNKVFLNMSDLCSQKCFEIAYFITKMYGFYADLSLIGSEEMLQNGTAEAKLTILAKNHLGFIVSKIFPLLTCVAKNIRFYLSSFSKFPVLENIRKKAMVFRMLSALEAHYFSSNDPQTVEILRRGMQWYQTSTYVTGEQNDSDDVENYNFSEISKYHFINECKKLSESASENEFGEIFRIMIRYVDHLNPNIGNVSIDTSNSNAES